jgi:hypothetical protein
MTSLNVEFILKNKILTGGYLTLKVPKWNPGASNVNTIKPMVETGFIVTAGKLMSQTALVATFSADILTIKGGVPNEIPAGSTVSFSVSKFHNPISTAVYTGFELTTYDSVGGTIDTDKDVILRISKSVSIPNGVLKSRDKTEVSERAVLRLEFDNPVPLNIGCVIEIIFPSEFVLSGADLVSV